MLPGLTLCQIRGHENEIEVLSWNWTVTNQSGPVTSGGGHAGRPNVFGVTFSHFVDLASPKLLRNCHGGTHIQRAVLSVHSDSNATSTGAAGTRLSTSFDVGTLQVT